jgi:membrane protease YdiL (CAAX protease family)
MRKRGAKRIVTILLVIFNVVLFAIMQPAFFGVRTYFGLDPRLIVMPVSFVTIIIIVLHLYQNWPLLLSWFKKSLDKKKQREKIWRMAVLIAFICILGYDIISAWYQALTGGGMAEVPVESIRVWSWVATALLAIHVWQRWRLTFSYFKRSPDRKAR